MGINLTEFQLRSIIVDSPYEKYDDNIQEGKYSLH
jgi:hypothetical protein